MMTHRQVVLLHAVYTSIDLSRDQTASFSDRHASLETAKELLKMVAEIDAQEKASAEPLDQDDNCG